MPHCSSLQYILLSLFLAVTLEAFESKYDTTQTTGASWMSKIHSAVTGLGSTLRSTRRCVRRSTGGGRAAVRPSCVPACNAPPGLRCMLAVALLAAGPTRKLVDYVRCITSIYNHRLRVWRMCMDDQIMHAAMQGRQRPALARCQQAPSVATQPGAQAHAAPSGRGARPRHLPGAGAGQGDGWREGRGRWRLGVCAGREGCGGQRRRGTRTRTGDSASIRYAASTPRGRQAPRVPASSSLPGGKRNTALQCPCQSRSDSCAQVARSTLHAQF